MGIPIERMAVDKFFSDPNISELVCSVELLVEVDSNRVIVRRVVGGKVYDSNSCCQDIWL